MSNPIRDEWTSDDGQHRILLGDCLEILPTLDTSEVAAVLADPPYGIGYQHSGGGKGLNSRKRFSEPISTTAGLGFTWTGTSAPFT